MRLWRIASERHDPLDGEGAGRFGGRWNSPGRPVVYTSAHASLAMLEKLVWTDPEDIPDGLQLYEMDIPGDLAPVPLDAALLPSGWSEAGSPACIRLGDEWLDRREHLALAVPSALVQEERNVLIDPLHADAGRIRVVAFRPFAFDIRLLE